MNSRAPTVVLLLLLSAGLALADDGGWTVIDRNRGITMSRRQQPDCALPAFRGAGLIQGNVLQILSVMLDLDRVSTWAFGVTSSRVLKRIDARTHLLYLHSDLPWPLRDRDMVVRSEVEVLRPAEEFRVTLRCRPEDQAEQSGIVRVQRCFSTFHVRRVDDNRTEIEYTMSLDPAGRLPNWSTELITKSAPFKTLVALEERAAKSEGKYRAAVRTWSAAM